MYNSVNWQAIVATLLPSAGMTFGSVLLKGEFEAKDGKKSWYHSLKKSNLTPPEWMYPTVWTGLYASMGYASYLVYRDGGGFQGEAKLPLIVYGSQLALNWAWPYIFFGAHSQKWALVEMVAMDVAVAVCGTMFYHVNHVAGYIFIPYFSWVTYAVAISFVNYRLNKETPKIKKIKD